MSVTCCELSGNKDVEEAFHQTSGQANFHRGKRVRPADFDFHSLIDKLKKLLNHLKIVYCLINKSVI